MELSGRKRTPVHSNCPSGSQCKGTSVVLPRQRRQFTKISMVTWTKLLDSNTHTIWCKEPLHDIKRFRTLRLEWISMPCKPLWQRHLHCTKIYSPFKCFFFKDAASRFFYIMTCGNSARRLCDTQYKKGWAASDPIYSLYKQQDLDYHCPYFGGKQPPCSQRTQTQLAASQLQFQGLWASIHLQTGNTPGTKLGPALFNAWQTPVLHMAMKAQGRGEGTGGGGGGTP